MALYTYVSNKKQVYKQLDAAFASMVNYYFKAIRATINISRTWDGFEKNPFRDVVDSGLFRDSQGQKQIGQMQHSIYWGAAYSAYVFFGGRTPQGTTFPGRRVDEIAAEETDLLTFFAKAFVSGGTLDVKGVVLFSGQEL